MLSGFRDFLFRGNVVDLAVAVIIGGAFGKVVEGFMKSFIEPLLAILLGGAGQGLDQVAVGGFPIGLFLAALLNFVLVALVVYVFIVKPLSGYAAKLAPKAGPPPADVVLLTEIRDLLKNR